jgi:histone arginine demethylase JMJD6
LKVFPELKDNVFPKIAYMENNWRDHWAWPKSWPEQVSKNLFEVFISAKEVSFPMLHFDYWGMDGFIAQLYGSKDIILYSPEDTPFLYPHPENRLVSRIKLK